MRFDKLEERMNGAETQEEQKESPLDSLLAKVDMADPLEIPMDSGQILTITQEQFISYYLPADASRTEKAKCFNETRAAGLNPAIRGDCHYFKTGGGPLSLFVGYHVYVRKAYANGLNHIQKPELVYDEETGELDSCIITLEIEGRPPFIWETWLSDVVAERNGQPNARWQKALRQMLIKCSVTNTFRMAGIASIGILPPTMDEMPDFSAPGYKNLTQEQLAAHDVEPAEATPGAVTAADHQIDTGKDRRTYRAILAEREVFPDDVLRKECQKHFTGKASTADFDHDDYLVMFDALARGLIAQWVQDNQPKPEPTPPAKAKTEDPPPSGGDEFLDNLDSVPTEHQNSAEEFIAEAAKRFLTTEDRNAWQGANLSTEETETLTPQQRFVLLLERVKELPVLAPENATDDAGQGNAQAESEKGNAQAESEKGQEQGEDQPEWDITSKTRKRIGELLTELQIYDSPRSQKFKKRIEPVIGRWLLKMQAMMETEGLDIVSSLETEIAADADHDDEPVDGLSPDAQGKEHEDQEAFSKEQLEEAKETGEIVDDDPLNAGVDSDRFCESSEWKELHRAYGDRLKAHLDATGKPVFASPDEQSIWEQAVSAESNIVGWDADTFDGVHNALDRRGVTKIVEPNDPATPEEPTDDAITEEQREKIKEITEAILPSTLNPHLSPNARHWISEAIGFRSPGLAGLKKEQGDKVIEYLQNVQKKRQTQGKDKPNVS